MTTAGTHTGLPELSDGQFWRVGKIRFSLYMPRSPLEYELVIIQRARQTFDVPIKWLGITWGWRSEERDVEFEIDRAGIGKAHGSEGDYKLTPENIREAAQRILDRQAEQARIDSLLGDYPPKSLKGDQ